jgi:hypothetical protein
MVDRLAIGRKFGGVRCLHAAGLLELSYCLSAVHPDRRWSIDAESNSPFADFHHGDGNTPVDHDFLS